MKQFLTLICVILISIGCDQYREFIKEIDYEQTVTSEFGYDLLNPSKKYFMSYSLEEISGLSYVSAHLLACIQDESGKIFLYDTDKKAITQRIKFHKGGDYEGIEVVGRTAYVIKSNGELFRVPLDDGDKPNAEKIKTAFSAKNDVEGLGYDPSNGMLLVACKNKGELGEKEVKGKAIYEYDPIAEKTNKKPLFTIQKSQLKDFVEQMKRSDKEVSFQPSAIAIHPIENRYYVLASAGKALIVLNRAFEIEEYIKLRPAVFNQPEGICFSPKGSLYVANEGDGEDGYILKFKYKN